ncbi:MAG: acyl-CoA dehydrogenase family protein [Dehalococcoidales bacterium]|nr:acyl-CoA dehydrogenase family protein [Dehalococcoidales bacterium]
MDFGFSQEEKAFREEVRGFIQKEFPSELKWHYRPTLAPSIYGLEGEAREFMKTMSRKLGEKGWLSLSWPEEYGGRNSLFLQNIFYEEMVYSDCPGIDPIGATFFAPTLIQFGSEEQKKKYLPGVARGEVYWCELLSEPDSGSDLASLKTQAVEDGDYYVINGQKIWNSGAHLADWGFILARTDTSLAKHKGLSYFMVDMKTPGITVNPIKNILGQDEFNEVFLDDVRVPKENLIGGKNKGWYVTMATLDFERTTHIFYPTVRAYLEQLSGYIKQKQKPLGPVLRSRLAELLVECEMARLFHYRAIWMIEKGSTLTDEAAVDKMYNSELAKKAADFGMQVLGSYGILLPESNYAYLNGWPSFYYLDTVSYSVMAGTTEVDKNVIATRGLGLPSS